MFITDFKYDYYYMYLYNLHTIINTYGYKYHWLNLSEEEFFNHTNKNCLDFSMGDPFLLDCRHDHKELGKSILKQGTYTPFFFFTNEQQQKMLLLGKHRLYSLYRCNNEKPILRKFLFIEYPFDPLDLESARTTGIQPSKKLYFFDNLTETPEFMLPKFIQQINELLLLSGDFLSSYFYKYKIFPSIYINSEEAFLNFLQTPMEMKSLEQCLLSKEENKKC